MHLLEVEEEEGGSPSSSTSSPPVLWPPQGAAAHLRNVPDVVEVQVQQFQPAETQDTIIIGTSRIQWEESAGGWGGVSVQVAESPAEAAEGPGHGVQAVPLRNEDLELHQSLDVLRQVLQAVGSQLEEHLQGGRREGGADRCAVVGAA